MAITYQYSARSKPGERTNKLAGIANPFSSRAYSHKR